MEEKKIAQWNDFKEWHQQHGPYDVIVDAANVAYYNQNFDGQVKFAELNGFLTSILQWWL